jgi:hypothetical protein
MKAVEPSVFITSGSPDGYVEPHRQTLSNVKITAIMPAAGYGLNSCRREVYGILRYYWAFSQEQKSSSIVR